MSNNTRANGTTTQQQQACAACKYQRRKCAPDCILAPYFPHHRQRQFLNAHKLFGVSNITKLLRKLPDPSDKDQAMRTIIFQSDARASDPVGGCYRIILELQRQIEYATAELHLVLQQLALCRAQAATLAADDSSTLINCDSIIMINPHDHDCEQGLEPPPREEEYYLEENNNVVPLQEIAASWALQVQDTASSSLPLNEHERGSFVDELGGGFKPTILDIGGERLELKFDHEDEEGTIEQISDEAISKEDKGMLKDEIASFVCKDNKATMLKEGGINIASEVVEDAHENHDLKSAAALFTLKKCNG